MAQRKGTALLVVYVDVDIENDAEFNRWYNEEHIPERLSAPGFLDGARYEALKGGPRYLAVYELESVEALHTPEYLHMSNNPTPWTQRMGPGTIGRGYVRNVYTQIYPQSGDDPDTLGRAWLPRSRSAVWTFLRSWRPGTTTTTTMFARRETSRSRAVCTSGAITPWKAGPST